jgi:hypothetical protein
MAGELVRVVTPLGSLTVKDGELRRGNLRLIKAQVRLEAGLDYTPIQGKLLLSPEGADRLNQIAGLSIFEPMDDKSWTDKRDAGGFIEVRRRCVVAGRTPTGTMQVVSASITFSPRAYFLHALVKKIGRERSAGMLGTPDDRPAPRGEKDTARWMYFPIDEALGVWADLTHKDVFGLVEAYAQDRKFADRRASGIVRRNALAQHGALGGQKMLGVYEKDKGAPESWTAPVFAWRSDDLAETETQAAEVAAAVGTGRMDHPALAGAEHRVAQVDVEDLEAAEVEDEGSEAEDPGVEVAARAPGALPEIPGLEG